MWAHDFMEPAGWSDMTTVAISRAKRQQFSLPDVATAGCKFPTERMWMTTQKGALWPGNAIVYGARPSKCSFPHGSWEGTPTS